MSALTVLRLSAVSPAMFLMVLTFINWLGFAGWNALIINFVVERAGFGWLGQA